MSRLVFVVYICAVLALVRCSVFEEEKTLLKRERRLAAGAVNVAKFFTSILTSAGLEYLVGLPLNEEKNQFDEILQKLKEIQSALNSIADAQKDLKQTITVNEATRIERKILALVTRYSILTEYIRDYRKNETGLTQSIDKLNKDLQDVPSMLIELGVLFLGNSIVSGGRQDGLLCDYVEYSYRSLPLSPTGNEVKTATNHINMYVNNLMEFQAASFQLYETACSKDSSLCLHEKVALKGRMDEQLRRFYHCVELYDIKEDTSGSSSINFGNLMCCVIGVLVKLLN